MEYPEELRLPKPLIFDSHAHFDDNKFNECREELLEMLPKNGVIGAITCGIDGESSKAALNLADKYDYIYAAVGLHPENLASNTPSEEIRELASHKKCVAIGEIGLDYNFCSENKAEQIDAFRRQLILANELDMPVIVHDRDAHEDTMKLLMEYKPKGVVHCFSGSPEMAKELLKIGMYIGIGGVVTFKNARRLPEVVEMLPEDRLLIETDCPYLAPEPYRGAICHSGYLTVVAQKIADIRGIYRDRIFEITFKNAQKLFSL